MNAAMAGSAGLRPHSGRARRAAGVLATLLALLAVSGCKPSGRPAPADTVSAPDCVLDGPALELGGDVRPADAKTYRQLPVRVPAGTGRLELSYGWVEAAGPPPTPLTATTLDLGLWDTDGYRAAAGFRGWSGSRQGRSAETPVFVEAGRADRGYLPGVIEPGVWHVELGIAAVSPQGARWQVRVACKSAPGTEPAPDPVDARHVARAGPDWYHGDFHMHAFHSNPNAPDDAGFIEQARAAQLDFLMVTEYVTGAHWRTLGGLQRANPDLLIWPGREVITYFGHVNTHGETPLLQEYRHGFEDVSLADIQRQARAADALFQVNHPTIFPPPLFANFCRGCYFELGEAIDWDAVDTLEILTGPVLATAADLGLPSPLPVAMEQPFMATAIALWHDLLRRGHKITAVSGSDSKGVDAPDERARKGYGSSATAVYAPELSRPALKAAIRAGHAYVRTRGVAASPALTFEAVSASGQRGIFGDRLAVGAAETVMLTTTVVGGQGQLLTYLRNGEPVSTVAITSDPFVHRLEVRRAPDNEGPLGTFWGIQTRDAQSRTAVGNPVFLGPP